MTEKIIIECPKCSKKVRVPVGKHIKFVCPSCSEELEYDDRNVNEKQADSESSENMKKPKERIGFVGHIILILLSLIIATPLIVGYYQYLMWIPINSIEIRMILIAFLFAFSLYILLFKFRNIALGLMIFLLLKMGYNQYFNKKGLTYEKAFRSYVALVEKKFENNPNLIKDVENAIVLSVESDIVSSVDYNSTEVKQFSNQASIKYFSENDDRLFREYGNIVRYFSVFKTINGAWQYVSDPVDTEHYAKASESLKSMAGDCDDHSILMAACIKAVGGQSRIVWVKGHAFPIVLVANDKYEFNIKVKPILHELFTDIYDDNFGVVQNEEGIWLSFDYTKKYPGGPFLEKEVIKLIKI
ncbi:Transglutaminase-like superfamily protein [Saccharicrinis carchari]|uniref:Transglutaminase-like superfamily protein n=1 Tax=Saccharicrinis carchari TaxID=1168039 RepID=A0A521FEY4_SACCC|nr:transglutaminase family protein [Saccharicrinis carchari]SMO94742.1 Transglutaminase-like superfamily protein [Saccharicrinis carchari]